MLGKALAGIAAIAITTGFSVAQAQDLKLYAFSSGALTIGKGALVKSSVHGTFDTGMGCSGENAAWIPDPFNQMVYGDGTIFGIILKDLTLGFDVAAHEMTHAVTFSTSMLDYMNEPGALNEAMSDIIGSGAEAWSKSGGSVAGNPMGGIKVDANTWKIGEEVAGFLLPGGALRLRFAEGLPLVDRGGGVAGRLLLDGALVEGPIELIRGDTVRFEPEGCLAEVVDCDSEQTGILPDRDRTRLFQRACQCGTLGRMNGPHQFTPHPASSSDNRDLHSILARLS